MAQATASVFCMGDQLEMMIDDLRYLVEAESPSNDRQLLAQSAETVADLMERRLGSRPDLIEGGSGPHVHWSGGGTPKVLILGHHDTVFPAGTLAQRPFAVADGRATGPGVFDMKGGIVQAIHAVASLQDASGVEILLSCDEEIGSLTSRAMLEERAMACGAVLVLEPSGDGGALKTGRKGTGTFEVVIGGRAAHAGLEPHRGVNSLVEAAYQVLAITKFADDEQGTTVTPTVAHSGTADNVVPAETRVRVDVRVTSAEEAHRIETAFAALEPVHPEATIVVNGRVGRPPMPESASAELMPLAVAHDSSIQGVAVGGGSDGNFTAACGVPTLDGLGAVGGGAHADHEFIEVATMPARAELLAAIIEARMN
jgi:glutamate carboxypeptidase